MKADKTYLIFNIIISTSIGILVGLVDIALPHIDETSIWTVLSSGLVGLLIGQSIKGFSLLVHGRMRALPMLLISALMLGVIAMIPALVEYAIFGSPIFTKSTFILLGLAEILGMSWTLFSYMYYKGLNEKLKLKQKEFSKLQFASGKNPKL